MEDWRSRARHIQLDPISCMRFAGPCSSAGRVWFRLIAVTASLSWKPRLAPSSRSMMVKRGEVWRKPSVSYDLRTDNWERIQQWCRHPEQRLYESIRPITLYGVTPAERASETNLPERTRRPTADSFDSSSDGEPVPSDQATTGGSPPFVAGPYASASAWI